MEENVSFSSLRCAISEISHQTEYDFFLTEVSCCRAAAANYHIQLKTGGRVGGVVAEPLPPQTRACATDALGSSPDRFAQGVCHERVIVTGGRGYRLRSSFIRSQFMRRKRLRRASHVRQMRVTW